MSERDSMTRFRKQYNSKVTCSLRCLICSKKDEGNGAGPTMYMMVLRKCVYVKIMANGLKSLKRDEALIRLIYVGSN